MLIKMNIYLYMNASSAPAGYEDDSLRHQEPPEPPTWIIMQIVYQIPAKSNQFCMKNYPYYPPEITRMKSFWILDDAL